MKRKNKSLLSRIVISLIDVLVILILLILGVIEIANITGIARVNNVIGTSMLPNYSEGNYVISSNKDMNINRGDVVIVEKEEYDVIKRVIGMPGETISIKNNTIYINGNELKEDYVQFNNNGKDTIKTLGENEYYILGDNRMTSKDSRYYGPITKNKIIGIVNYKISFDENNEIIIENVR